MRGYSVVAPTSSPLIFLLFLYIFSAIVVIWDDLVHHGGMFVFIFFCEC